MRESGVVVVGGGLAGSEAAWQLARRGVPVTLYEMRPVKTTAAHTTSDLGELVCSNSFGSETANSASQILKEELLALDAFILHCAREARVPAGKSLAVDREIFAKSITATLQEHPLIDVRREELQEIPANQITILATGPLTSMAMTDTLSRLTGQGNLYFYDAISPIVSTDSLDLDKLYYASRYDKGDPDFLNLPLNEVQYRELIADLLSAQVVLPHNFEEEKYFEGCMPIEAIASRGPMTLAFGPMKPVGLPDPKTGKIAYAVIQLRAENRYRTAYNLVGFQTKMKYGEQERIFRKLPGLENAEFLRLGSMHRNTYIHSPQLLRPSLQLLSDSNVFIAGQITGTEGYLESSAMGWLAGVNAARLLRNEDPVVPPPEMMLGALVHAITDRNRIHFQPINSNIGILPPLETRAKGKDQRNAAHAARSQKTLLDWKLKLATSESLPAVAQPPLEHPPLHPNG